MSSWLCVQLRICRVEEAFPALSFVAGRQGELDGLVMGVEYDQQCCVSPPPLNSRRLSPPIQQHAKTARSVVPRLGRHLRAVGVDPRDVRHLKVGIHFAGQEAQTPEHRVKVKSGRQATEEVHKREAVLIYVPMDPTRLVVLAICIVVAVLRAAELVTRADHRSALRQDERRKQISELTPP